MKKQSEEWRRKLWPPRVNDCMKDRPAGRVLVATVVGGRVVWVDKSERK